MRRGLGAGALRTFRGPVEVQDGVFPMWGNDQPVHLRGAPPHTQSHPPYLAKEGIGAHLPVFEELHLLSEVEHVQFLQSAGELSKGAGAPSAAQRRSRQHEWYERFYLETIGNALCFLFLTTALPPRVRSSVRGHGSLLWTPSCVR
jgi:hypothetical protein